MPARRMLAPSTAVLLLGLTRCGFAAVNQGPSTVPQVVWMRSISGSTDDSVPIRRSRREGTGQLTRIARGVSTDRHKGVFISGSFFGECTLDGQRLSSAGAADVFVGRLDGDGKVRWFKRFGAGGTDISPDVATDRSGNCVVTGMCSDGTVTPNQSASPSR